MVNRRGGEKEKLKEKEKVRNQYNRYAQVDASISGTLLTG